MLQLRFSNELTLFFIESRTVHSQHIDLVQSARLRPINCRLPKIEPASPPRATSADSNLPTKNYMKKLIAITIAAISLAFSDNALAHGIKAKRGGIVQSAGDYSFELVCLNGSGIIYVEEHGKELATVGATGILTVFKGAERKVVPLEAGMGNTLVAPGGRLAHWTKAVASITFPNRSAVRVRFNLN